MAWTRPKTCSRCGEDREDEDFYFHRRPDRQSQRPLVCRICTTRNGGPRMTVAERHRLRRYGVTPAQLSRMLDEQEHACAICRVPFHLTPGKGQYHIDHDHDTDAVRGLLCWGCNVGLGSYQDNPARLRAAASYLEKNR